MDLDRHLLELKEGFTIFQDRFVSLYIWAAELFESMKIVKSCIHANEVTSLQVWPPAHTFSLNVEHCVTCAGS